MFTIKRFLPADDLAPTEDTIKQIATNQNLLAGFDDPEVMRAVQDVAQNPANIQKYKNNKKVWSSLLFNAAVMHKINCSAVYS